jgi:hypothetical protein
LAPGEGLTLAPAPEVSFTLKTGSDETNGVWTLFEYTVPPRFAGPPPHWHKTTDEGFFILDGTVRFEVNGETTTSRPAATHACRQASSTASRTPPTSPLASSGLPSQAVSSGTSWSSAS